MIRVKKVLRTVKPDYPNKVKQAIETLTPDRIASLLSKTKGRFFKAESRGQDFPRSFGDGLPEVWEKKEASLTLDDADARICITGWRQVSPIVRRRWVVEVYAINLNPSPWPSDDDGRDLNCEGWGCWECNYGGGY